MKVLIACSYGSRLRELFKQQGHDTWSCDILPTEIPGQHIQDDVLNHLDKNWDLMVAFPPCTHLAVSGARHFAAKRADGRQQAGIEFFMKLVKAPIRKKAIENPIGIMSSFYRKPDQIIQPWQFGLGETKSTCLWLENLSPLKPTKIVEGRVPRVWLEPPSPDRWAKRSQVAQGILQAMADQWGKDL